MRRGVGAALRHGCSREAWVQHGGMGAAGRHGCAMAEPGWPAPRETGALGVEFLVRFRSGLRRSGDLDSLGREPKWSFACMFLGRYQ